MSSPTPKAYGQINKTISIDCSCSLTLSDFIAAKNSILAAMKYLQDTYLDGAVDRLIISGKYRSEG